MKQQQTLDISKYDVHRIVASLRFYNDQIRHDRRLKDIVEHNCRIIDACNIIIYEEQRG